MIWLAFACGVVVGTPLGIIITALCVANRRAAERAEVEAYRRTQRTMLDRASWGRYQTWWLN
jgi:uncharacterized membrane-anchored protein YhcB (DUF1043 family)